MNSAHVPSGRFHWPFQTHTRSPTRSPGTPDPTFSITPPAVAVGDNARREHRAGSGPRLDVGGVDARGFNRDADLTGTWLGGRHFADPENLPRWARPLIPSRSHRGAPPNLQATIIDHDRGPGTIFARSSLGVSNSSLQRGQRGAGEDHGSGDLSASQGAILRSARIDGRARVMARMVVQPGRRY